MWNKVVSFLWEIYFFEQWYGIVYYLVLENDIRKVQENLYFQENVFIFFWEV